jgi:hypothetical protein
MSWSWINEGVWDRIIRVAIGVVLLYLGWSGVVEGGWGTFLKYFGFFPLATGLSGFCVLYPLFGFRTNKPAIEKITTERQKVTTS